jgi:hypothetical protein
MESGAWSEEVELMKTAMPLCRDKESLIYANLANSLGSMEVERGHVAESRELMEKSLQIRQNSLPADHVEVANSLNNYANLILLELGPDACKKAMKLYNQCVEINLKAPKSHSDYFLHVPHTNMARALWVMEDYEGSMEHSELSRKYSIKFLGEGNHFDAT